MMTAMMTVRESQLVSKHDVLNELRTRVFVWREALLYLFYALASHARGIYDEGGGLLFFLR